MHSIPDSSPPQIPVEELYSQLKRDIHGQREIRLFSLFPGTGNSPIRGHLFIIGTEHTAIGFARVNYEALSYVWGDEKDQITIFINGHGFSITRNLYAALSRLRQCDRERVLWIDAICINQIDAEERGHQVSLMREIYGSAFQVLAWLGGAGVHGSNGMKELASLLYANPPHQTALYVFDEGFSESFRDILTRPWWSRLWVIQEAAVAKRLTFLCGEYILELPNRPEELSELADALRYARPTGTAALSYNGICHEQLSGLILNQRDRALDAKSKLQSLVYTYLLRECSDPRDRVFALLGLSRPSDLTRNPADYSMTVEAVAMRLLCHSARDIDPETEANTENGETCQLEKICKSLVGRNRGNQVFHASRRSTVGLKWHHVPNMSPYPVLSGIIVDTIAINDDYVQTTTPPDDPGVNYWNLFMRERSVGHNVNTHQHPKFQIMRTSRGRQACVPRIALAGDKLCIFLGFPCPFVVRQAEDKMFDILGECCLPGVMDGETVDFEQAHEILAVENWNWSYGLLRRQRRHAFSFSTRYNPDNGFFDYIRVAPGLELQDILLNKWIGEM
ncbi:hypothetical protein BP6252_14046 [Coleophoma cylindrospora]|uniref:Heterokaryon incompatibility domain-containing protein n=1 Tax=Coleophoma cylindrospora TaxID=1849047 RepID=A0A3D8Q5K7_9HELO|nr:hypothetical protein BP6252_14046 [Coleophoma cylindrospora]